MNVLVPEAYAALGLHMGLQVFYEVFATHRGCREGDQVRAVPMYVNKKFEGYYKCDCRSVRS